MKTAIFDLDGTLADTSRDLLHAGNACFLADGYAPPLTHADHAAIALRGGRAMLRAGAEILNITWSEDDIQRHYPRLLQVYGENIDVHTVLYPGVLAALDRLAAAGWHLGICTNKPEGLAETLTAKLGIRDRFQALIGADTLPVRKPDPEALFEAIRRAGGDRAQAVLFGDTITDHTTARNAGIASVLVSFGPLGASVAEMGPDALLPHYDQIEDVLATLF